MTKASIEQILREKIISGRISPGERLIEETLSKSLKVSRTPLRQSLQVLEKEGLLIRKPNAGYSVKPLESEELRELYPIVWTLETLALQESFGKVQTRLKELRNLNAAFLRAKKDPKLAGEIDDEFHLALIKGCDNKTLLQMVAELKRRLLRYAVRYMEDPLLLNTSYKQHAELLNAIGEGERATALIILRKNWEFGMNALLARIEDS